MTYLNVPNLTDLSIEDRHCFSVRRCKENSNRWSGGSHQLALTSHSWLKIFLAVPICLRKVLFMEKDSAKSAGQNVPKVLFRRQKSPFLGSEKCYFRRNICRFLGPVLLLLSPRLTVCKLQDDPVHRIRR